MSNLKVEQKIYESENFEITGEQVIFMQSSNENIERNLRSVSGKTTLFMVGGHLLIVKIDKENPTQFYTVTTSKINPGKTKYGIMGMVTYTTMSGSKYTFVRKSHFAKAVIDLYAEECQNIFGLCKVKKVDIM